MKALRDKPPTLYSPTVSLLRLCHPLNLSHMTAPGLRPLQKEVKNLIARTHYLEPIVEADDLLAYAAGERIRLMEGDAFNPIQWWVKKLEDQPTVA